MPLQISVPTPKTGISNYRVFLLHLRDRLKKEDLVKIKYILQDVIPEGVLEKLVEPLALFSALEERNLLGPDNLDNLRQYLTAIERPKIVEMIDEYDDADTKYPLKQRSDNRLQKDGFSVSIKGGRHFETSKGEFVVVRSGTNYALVISNQNNQRCIFYVEVDGYVMFPDGIQLGAKQKCTIERPSSTAQKFKFFAISDAPAGSGINRYRKEQNGLIQVKFLPERADMRIHCNASGCATEVISCSSEIIDTDFLKLLSNVYGDAAVTVMITRCKPLGQRGVKLVEYGVTDGSRVNVSLGLNGGGDLRSSFNNRSSIDKFPEKVISWSKFKAGATTLEGVSDQQFIELKSFPSSRSQAVTLNLRLVARENETALPSEGNPTPLANATLIPPPVSNV